MACSRSQSFPDDRKLHNLIDELKVTLFDTIPSLANKLRPKAVDVLRPKSIRELIRQVETDLFATNSQRSGEVH